MKKLFTLLLSAVLLFASAALAEDLSALSDEELTLLHREVLAEMASRGLSAGEETPAGVEDDDPVITRLAEFFALWNRTDLDGMLPLCAPDWREAQENPRTALFAVLANRTPLSLEPILVLGEPGDPVRTVQADSLMDRNNGLPPEIRRLQIVMKADVSGVWYVDPSSLRTFEPAAVMSTPEPAASGDTVLYWNPQGGTRYHLEPNCLSVHPKFVPLEGSFTFSQVNDEPYRDLMPCNVCGAPPREEAPEEDAGN